MLHSEPHQCRLLACLPACLLACLPGALPFPPRSPSLSSALSNSAPSPPLPPPLPLSAHQRAVQLLARVPGCPAPHRGRREPGLVRKHGGVGARERPPHPPRVAVSSSSRGAGAGKARFAHLLIPPRVVFVTVRCQKHVLSVSGLSRGAGTGEARFAHGARWYGAILFLRCGH